MGPLGDNSHQKLARLYGMGPLGPLILPRGGEAGDGCVADEGDEEGEGHAACGISYVAHQHGGYGATYYRHNEEGGEM